MSPYPQSEVMPAVFVSHGSPMVALQRGPYQEALAGLGRTAKPRAIVAISAHWGSGTSISITGNEPHAPIHDFGGFPAALYELTYDAPGSPELAARIADLLRAGGWNAEVAHDRGLDHGVWIPLRLMYPTADIPVVELSIPLQFSPEELYQLGAALAPMTRTGVPNPASG